MTRLESPRLAFLPLLSLWTRQNGDADLECWSAEVLKSTLATGAVCPLWFREQRTQTCLCACTTDISGVSLTIGSL